MRLGLQNGKTFSMKFLFFLLFISSSYGAKLSPSLLIFHEWDLNACPQRIKKILDLKTEGLQVLISGHHESNENKTVTKYKYFSDTGRYIDLNKEVLLTFKQKVKKCLELIPDETKLAITLHINDSRSTGYWRNFIIFDPLDKKQGYSYFDFLIKPVVDVLSELKKKNINISLQGEMGATIFAYPESYLAIIKRLKRDQPLWQFGISLNFNEINGGIRLSKYKKMQELLNSLDFFGFSAYQPFAPNSIYYHFNNSGANFLKQLQAHRVVLPKTTPLHFREVGIGGGNWKNDGWSPATNPYEASANPYAGLYEPKNNPWNDSTMKKFRYKYHKELIRFLKSSELRTINPVTEAFLWNTGSWDPLNLYPGSEPFKDLSIIDEIIRQ